mgnify:CR=1 FL=1
MSLGSLELYAPFDSMLYSSLGPIFRAFSTLVTSLVHDPCGPTCVVHVPVFSRHHHLKQLETYTESKLVAKLSTLRKGNIRLHKEPMDGVAQVKDCY